MAVVPFSFDVTLVDYKILVRSEDRRKAPKWESIPNRTLSLPDGDKMDHTVLLCWEQPERTEITTVEPVQQPSTALFHIRGNSSMSTRAVQVPAEARSLNSGDAFVAQSKEAMYLWYGKGCNKGERKYAKAVAKLLAALDGDKKRKLIKIEESEEPDDFWKLLGGKSAYASAEVLAAQNELPPARLFWCTNISGSFKV